MNDATRRLDRQSGTIMVASNTRTGPDGTPVTDVIDPESPEGRVGCPIMVMGGPGSYQHAAPQDGANVVVLRLDHGRMVVLGGVLQGSRTFKDRADEHDGNQDRGTKARPKAYVIEAHGASVFIDTNGSITMTPKQGREVNIQGPLRVSTGHADDFVASAGGTISQLQDLADRLNSLEQRYLAHIKEAAGMAHNPANAEVAIPVTVDPDAIIARAVRIPSDG